MKQIRKVNIPEYECSFESEMHDIADQLNEVIGAINDLIAYHALPAYDERRLEAAGRLFGDDVVARIQKLKEDSADMDESLAKLNALATGKR